ncbi:MAG TPA: hypothetical protein GXX35_02340 [Thermoanaerobacterales bacterium]|nr:hypothetical protein [Thermoanaerobacterales bacterium]
MTRIFSYLAWYHYAFIIISTAILGLGLGGIWVQRQIAENKNDIDAISVTDLLWVLLLSYIAISLTLYINLFNFFPILYMFIGIIPFTIGGAIISIIFTKMVRYVNVLYFADLLGTGIFALASFYILNNYGMMVSLLFLFAVLLIILGLDSFISKNVSVSLIVIVLLLISIVVSTRDLSGMEKNFGYPLTSQKLKVYDISDDGKTKIEYTKWDAFSRTDVIDYGNEKEKTIFIDSSSAAFMYRFNGDLKLVSGLKNSVGFLPYILQKNPKTLVIGPGGGRDILLALLAGSKDITAVEINKSSVDAVEKNSSFTGDLYNLPQVKTHIQDGRNFIERTKEKYDTVFLSLVMTQTASSGSLALNENYIYTQEAISKYLEHLTDNGQLVFAAHDEEDTRRIITTVLSVLKKKGIPYRDALHQIAIVADKIEQTHNHDPKHLHFPVIIIRNQPFIQTQSIQLIKTVLQNNMEPVFIPHIFENKKLPLSKYKDVDDIIKSSASNAIPTTDDRPFFYDFSFGLPKAVYLVLLVVFFAIYKWIVPNYKKMDNRDKSLVNYFFAIGIGFMALEIALIQKNILFLGHPSLSFLATVILLLVGCSIGSLTGKILEKEIKILPLVLSGIIVLVTILYKYALLTYIAQAIYVKIVILALILLPLGTIMGVFFPTGIRQLANTDLVPFMWGVNGVASLLGSTLATVIAMFFGFSYSMIFSAAAYFSLTFFVKKFQAG